MDNKPLHIPQTKKLKGLKVHCYECGTTVDSICKKTGAGIATCKHGQDHVFKAFAHVPGTDNARKTKALPTRNLEEARRLTLEFQKEIKENVNNAPKEITMLPEHVKLFQSDIQKIAAPVAPQEKSYNLIELMAQYVGYLNNDPELVPEHRKKERSKSHLSQVELVFNYCIAAFQKNGYEVKTLRADQVNDRMIGKLHSYLLEDKNYGNRSYNRAISVMTSFYKYLSLEGYQVANPFETVIRKPTSESVETIDKEEFERLLDIIQKPELGMHSVSKNKRKSFYRPYMHHALELALYSGRRREEIARMKWSDIARNKDGKALYIAVADLKVNRQKNNSEKDENLKYNYVPMTHELSELLSRMNENEYRDTEKYILAPNETMSRQTLTSFLSRSFAHYHAQLNTGRELSFNCLRRTNFSRLSSEKGIEDTKVVSGHSSVQVLKKHYIDTRVIASVAKDFSVFGKKKKEKNSEIDEIRNRRDKPDKGLDIAI
ncbi:MAG: tyrosine-type recombinase/integrase [Bacteroidia bacterium]